MYCLFPVIGLTAFWPGWQNCREKLAGRKPRGAGAGKDAGKIG